MPEIYKFITDTPQSAVALTVSGGATPTDTSKAYLVSQARDLLLQMRNGASTSLNIYVYTSPDDSVYDDVAFASWNLGANQEITRPITVGVFFVKVVCTNADAANATSVTTKLMQRI